MVTDRSQERPLFIAPEEVEASVSPNGQVWLRIGPPHASLGFDPNMVFALELSPKEARSIAELLTRKAREAEGGSPSLS